MTRDQGLLKRSAVTHGYWVRATAPREQLREVMARFDLQRLAQPFTRCLSLQRPAASGNAGLKSKTKCRKTPHVSITKFWRCTSCGKVYWQGSHYQRMTRLIEEIQLTAEGAENAEHE